MSTSVRTSVPVQWSIPGQPWVPARRLARACIFPAASGSAACWNRCRPAPRSSRMIASSARVRKWWKAWWSNAAAYSAWAYISGNRRASTIAPPKQSATAACLRAAWWCPAACPPRTVRTICTRRSSSSAWTRRRVRRRRSTNCCGVANERDPLRIAHLRYLPQGAQLAGPLRRGIRLRGLSCESGSGGDLEGLGKPTRWLGKAGQQGFDDVAQPVAATQEPRERSGVDIAPEGISRVDPPTGRRARQRRSQRRLQRQRLQENLRHITGVIDPRARRYLKNLRVERDNEALYARLAAVASDPRLDRKS